jgi:hypothetical protein
MNSNKCFQCGFVSARSNEACKRCGASFKAAPGNAQKSVGPRELKVAACFVIAIVTLIMGIRFMLSLFSSKNPTPSELASLLNSTDAIKSPITFSIETEMTETSASGNLSRSNFEGYAQGHVLEHFGLADASFSVSKADKQMCYRFDYKILSEQERIELWRSYAPRPEIKDPDGYNEKCYDVWNYRTTVKLIDPSTVSKSSMLESLWTVSDISDPPPDLKQLNTRKDSWRDGSSHDSSVPIGSVEIVEVSDIVPGDQKDKYIVGFKYRFKPNSLGELFDVSSPIHKKMPEWFRKLTDSVWLDRRLGDISKGISDDGLMFGHADLITENSYRLQWKITAVYFDAIDRTKNTYHQVD